MKVLRSLFVSVLLLVGCGPDGNPQPDLSIGACVPEVVAAARACVNSRTGAYCYNGARLCARCTGGPGCNGLVDSDGGTREVFCTSDCATFCRSEGQAFGEACN